MDSEKLRPRHYATCPLADAFCDALISAYQTDFTEIDGVGSRDFETQVQTLLDLLVGDSLDIGRPRLLSLLWSLGQSSLVVANECLPEDPRPRLVVERLDQLLTFADTDTTQTPIDFADVGRIGRTQEADEVLLASRFIDRAIRGEGDLLNACECADLCLTSFAIVPGNQWMLRRLWRWFLEEALPAAYCKVPARIFDYREYLCEQEILEREHWDRLALWKSINEEVGTMPIDGGRPIGGDQSGTV